MQKLNLLLGLLLIVMISCADNKSEQKNHVVNSEVQSSRSNLQSFVGNDYLLDAQHSYIGFKIKYFGYSPVRGRFDEVDGTVFYDEENISNFSISAFIDANSINTGNESRDNDLMSDGKWFDTSKYPTLSFSSTHVIPKTNGEFDLAGNLTIKGITKVDTINIKKPTGLSKDYAGNDQIDFSGTVTINRQDFGVVGGDFWSTVMEKGLTQLSDEVEIEIDIHCRKADYIRRYEDADSANVRKVILDEIKMSGIRRGLEVIDSNYQNNNLSAGAMSTIGYTLNAWQMYEEAKVVFEKKLEYYPEKFSTLNQLGITNLFLGNQEIAREKFESLLKLDSTNSRAYEYLNLINTGLNN